VTASQTNEQTNRSIRAARSLWVTLLLHAICMRSQKLGRVGGVAVFINKINQDNPERTQLWNRRRHHPSPCNHVSASSSLLTKQTYQTGPQPKPLL